MAIPERMNWSDYDGEAAVRKAATLSKIDCFLIISFSIVQIGLNYWVCFAPALAIICIARYSPIVISGFSKILFFIIPINILMFLPLATIDSPDIVQDLLRLARESLFFFLFVAALSGSRQFQFHYDRRLLRNTLTIMAVAIFALVLFQQWQLSKGVYFGVPKDLFSQGQNTIPDENDLIYSHIRPAATFSEPSYLAFVLISLLLINQTFKAGGGISIAAAILLTLTGFLCQSFSFVISFAALALLAIFSETAYRSWRKPAVILGIVLATTATGGLLSSLGDARIFNAAYIDNDLSTFARIVGPLITLPQFLVRYPLGTPPMFTDTALDSFAQYYGMIGSDWSHDFVFNLVYHYGVSSVPIAMLLLYRTSKFEFAYIFLSAFFNGSLFAPDKFVVMSVTCIFLRAAASPSFRRKPEPGNDWRAKAMVA